jgi:hypothetical protein
LNSINHWTLELIGTPWNLLELTGTHWNLLELTGLDRTQRNSLDSTTGLNNTTMHPMDTTGSSSTTSAPSSIEQAFQAFLQQMTQSNAINQQTLQGLQNVLQQNAHVSQRKERQEKLPQLSEFDGTRSKFDGWEIEARNKVKTDGKAMGSEMDQLRYIFARLRSNARNMCLAFVRAKEEEGSGTGIQLLDYLACTYSDPNRQKKALNNLYTIKQKTQESFARFLPRFETELANAGALSFDNTIKISLLENALNHSMQERLVSVFPVPTEYNAFTSLLQTIGSRLDALHTPWKGSSQPRPIQDTNVDTMDWEPTHTFAASTNHRAKWVNREEIERRRSNRLCIRCGASGHMIRSCQYAPARRLSPAVVATTKFEQPQLEEDTESGKE